MLHILLLGYNEDKDKPYVHNVLERRMNMGNEYKNIKDPFDAIIGLLDDMGKEIEKAADETFKAIDKIFEEDPVFDRIHDAVKDTVKKTEEILETPCGWYIVKKEDGEPYKLMVFEDQFGAYRSIAGNIDNPGDLMKYFEDCRIKPYEAELKYLKAFIEEEKEMPEYFDLEEKYGPFRAVGCASEAIKDCLREVKEQYVCREDEEAETEVSEGFKFCRECGNKLPADSKFCDKCGSRTDY